MTRRRRTRTQLSWTTNVGGMPVWGIVASAVVIVGLFGGGLVYSSLNQAAEADAYVPPSTPHTPTEEAPAPLSYAVIGDSYSFGLRASAPSASWPRVFSAATGSPVEVLAVSGSGYTVEGPAEPGVFGTRVAAAAATSPDVIVFQGSINDLGQEGVQDAATSALTEARAAMPAARCVVIGPTYIPQEGPERIDALTVEVQGAAGTAGCEFLDARAWVPLDQFADGAHPNDAGYATFAAAVKTALAP